VLHDEPIASVNLGRGIVTRTPQVRRGSYRRDALLGSFNLCGERWGKNRGKGCMKRPPFLAINAF